MAKIRVLVCPEPFSGGLSAQQVAQVIADGLTSTSTHFEVQQVPLSIDEQVVETVVAARGGEWRDTVVLGEQGTSVRVRYGLIDEGKIAVVTPHRVPVRSLQGTGAGDMTSFGAGQLLKVVLQEKTVERVYWYLPEGTWPVDGGVGFLQALGVSLLDPDGKSISWATNSLARLTRVDFRGLLPRLQQVELIVGCHTLSPLLGRQGAAWTWGSRTGANFPTIERIEIGLTTLANALQRTNGGECHAQLGSAAGGGLGYGLALVGAQLRPAQQVFLENLNLQEQIRHVQLVITGQAQTDRRTLPQHTIPSILRMCQTSATPALVLSGGIRPKELESVLNSGAWAVLDTYPGPMSTTQMVEQAAEHLYFTAQQVGRLLLLGQKLAP